MRVVRGDLIQLALRGGFDVIVHGCNCMCVMGAGIAKTIRATFPEAYAVDKTTTKGDRTKLGTITHATVVREGHSITVVNAYTQFDYRGSGIHVDYDAVRAAFRAIKKQFSGKRIGYPRIGAGLARGDWKLLASTMTRSSTVKTTRWSSSSRARRRVDRKEFRRCIALIGDVHAEHRTLATALSILRDLEASLILCAGDITDGVGDVDACCALLEEHHVLTIAGNHDRWVLADTMRTLPHATERASLSPRTVAFLASLPATRRIPLPFGSGLLCHGLGTNDMSGVTPDDYGYELEMNFALDALVRDPSVSVVFNGHTHRRMVRHFDGLTIVNGGTLARRQDPGVVLVHAETHAVGWLPLDAASSAVEPLGTLVRNP